MTIFALFMTKAGQSKIASPVFILAKKCNYHMGGDTNFKGSGSNDPSVSFLLCEASMFTIKYHYILILYLGVFTVSLKLPSFSLKQSSKYFKTSTSVHDL